MATDTKQQPEELAGQVAIVTGGGRGYGREIALALARAGAAVTVTARSQDQLAETVALAQKAGGQAIAIPADVIDQDAVHRMVEQTERELGPIDLLVNNAGSAVAIGPVWEVDPDVWWRDVETNLRGTCLCTRAVLKGMVTRRRGRIISVSSKGFPYLTAYDCSKVAITRFTHMLAGETKEHGIYVFSIVDGPARTAMVEHLSGSKEAQRWVPWFSGFAAKNPAPIGRLAQLVLFLASGKGDALSGRYIAGWDNWPEMVRRADEIERDDLFVWSMHGFQKPVF